MKRGTALGKHGRGVRPTPPSVSAKQAWSRCRIPRPGKKRLIEDAYELAEEAGLPLWCQDEAGPYQAIPQPGEDWHLQGKPTMQPHEYVRGGTAKLLTLLRPATGDVLANGVLSAPNAVLHPWLQE